MRDSVSDRAEMFRRAEAAYPTPYTINFPMRALLVKYTEQCDKVNHPWYTYVYAETGQIMFYFVSTTMPVSTNAFLGSTESVDEYNDLVLTAPSLDGIYYGGAGSVTGSNGWIFEDAATGGIGVVFGASVMTFEAPIVLETEPMLVQAPAPIK